MIALYDETELYRSYFENAAEKLELLRRLPQRFKRESLRPPVLADLGCHDGALTLKLLAAVDGQLADRTQIHCVEPYGPALDLFRRRPERPRRFDFTFVRATADQYLTLHPEREHDWILASHSLYWCADLKATLARIVSATRHALVVMREPTGLYEVQETFRAHVGNPHERGYHADHAEAALKALGVRYDRERIRSPIAIPAVSDNLVHLLTAFFLQRASAETPPDLVAQVHAYLRGRAAGDEFPHDVSMFWIDR